MKRLAILLVTFLFVLSAVHVQGQTQNASKETKKEQKTEKKELKKLEGVNVDPRAKSSFLTDFGNLPNVTWKRVATFDEARFTSKDGKMMTAFYDSDGRLVGTTSPSAFTALPAAAQTEIKNKYKDYTVGSVIFYDDNEINETDMVMYGIQFDDSDNYFVELTKGTGKIVLRVNPGGTVFFFKKL
jgi:hypothetical protein